MPTFSPLDATGAITVTRPRRFSLLARDLGASVLAGLALAEAVLLAVAQAVIGGVLIAGACLLIGVCSIIG
jgi:hypothetical protein